MRPIPTIKRLALWWGAAVILAALCSVATRVGQKPILEIFHETAMVLFVVTAVQTLLGVPFCVVAWRHAVRTQGRVCRNPRRVAVHALCYGSLVSVSMYLYMEALGEASLSAVTPLRNTGPLFAFFVGWVLAGERHAWRLRLCGVIAVVAGVFCVQGINPAAIGVRPAFFAVGSAALLALSGHFNKQVVGEKAAGMPSTVFAFIEGAIGTVLFAIWAWSERGSFSALSGLMQYVLDRPMLTVLITVPPALGTLLGMRALRTGGQAQTSALARIEIIFTLIAGAAFFGERITPQLVIGGAVLMAGAIVVSLPQKT